MVEEFNQASLRGCIFSQWKIFFQIEQGNKFAQCVSECVFNNEQKLAPEWQNE